MRILSKSLVVVIICAVLAGCAGKGKKLFRGTMDAPWYKRYTGTIDGLPVVLSLHHYEDVTIGQFYFAAKSVIIDLTDLENEGGYDLFLGEDTRSEREEEDENFKPNKWAVNIDNNTIRGKRMMGDGSTAGDIELHEEYPAGSYPLKLTERQDSVRVKKGIRLNTALSAYQVLEPAGKMNSGDEVFVRSTVMNLLGADSPGNSNVAEFIERENVRYFDNYKRLLADTKVEKKEHTPEDAYMYNFYHSRNIWAVYNDDDLLVLESHEYDYSGGGGHGNYINHYASIDMREKKIWMLNDIMEMDPAVLLPLLGKELRHSFRMKPADTLSNRLSVDTIRLSENMFITAAGINFCYNPRILAPESDGEIVLFLPYDKLLPLLKEPFKRRMGLMK